MLGETHVATTDAEGINILVIDDNVIQLAVMDKLLREEGRSIYKANSGQKGFDLACEHDMGLIILDIRMPGLSGFETAKLLKEDKRTQHVPIVFMTAVDGSEEEEMIKGFESGAIDFIYKPINIPLTREKVNSYLKIQEYRRVIEKQAKAIEEEKAQFHDLLLRILPTEIVDELSEKGVAEAKHFEQVSVLFTDFVGFTQLAKKLPPEKLVSLLDNHFGAFDTIIEKNHVEKIKTIGDAYMCAGGVPLADTTNAIRTVLAALQIREYVSSINAIATENGDIPWNIRIGVHTGEVTAGVIGHKRLAYDIWGDTVNIASRMESTSEVGQVNISDDTFKLVEPYASCTSRGKLPVKNGGEVGMYFVERLLPEFSKDEGGTQPNERLLELIG